MGALASIIAGLGSVPSLINSAIAFFKSPFGKLVGVGLMIALASGIAYDKGKTVSEAKCDAAAARADAEALRIDRDNLAARADHATKVLAVLGAMDARNKEEIERLRQELATLPLQSTKPGAKHDPNALMDDRCNLTERGASGLR